MCEVWQDVDQMCNCSLTTTELLIASSVHGAFGWFRIQTSCTSVTITRQLVAARKSRRPKET